MRHPAARWHRFSVSLVAKGDLMEGRDHGYSLIPDPATAVGLPLQRDTRSVAHIDREPTANLFHLRDCRGGNDHDARVGEAGRPGPAPVSGAGRHALSLPGLKARASRAVW
jgi:hypothetical protein